MKFKNGYYVAALWIFLLIGVKCSGKYEISDAQKESRRLYFALGYMTAIQAMHKLSGKAFDGKDAMQLYTLDSLKFEQSLNK